jgi:hypothetical protein
MKGADMLERAMIYANPQYLVPYNIVYIMIRI